MDCIRAGLAKTIICLSVLFYATSAFATSYEFIWSPPQPNPANCTIAGGGINNSAGVLEELEIKWDSVMDIMSYTATFSSCNGFLPNGYWTAVNNGPIPRGKEGELAIFYFDGTNPANPILSIYGYNGENGDSSFYDGVRNSTQPGNQAPDRILTNHPDAGVATPWLLQISVTDNPDGTRTLHFMIDASDIVNHVPVYPDPVEPWFGVGMDVEVGFWFHTRAQMTAEYCGASDVHPVCQNVAPGQSSVGYLKTLGQQVGGWYDKEHMKTNTVPYCTVRTNILQGAVETQAAGLTRTGPPTTITAPKCIDVKIGEQFMALVTGNDGDDEALIVDYSGAPAGAIIDPVSGTLVATPAVISFDWTPAVAQGGQQFNVDFTFTDKAEASTKCALPLCVQPNLPPVCDLKVTTENPMCGGAQTLINYSGADSKDPEGETLQLAWSTTCLNEEGNAETINVVNAQQAQLILTEPGKGRKVENCQVTLTVTDSVHSVSCSAPVEVEACPLDCLGVPNGNAVVDQCGVCNGTNACLDCAGTPNGGKVNDLCGVCGGNNGCLDCEGTPNGGKTLDQCNVCGGDGTSCLGCSDTNILNALFQLDGGAEQQRALVYRATGDWLRNKSNSKRTLAFADAIRAEADSLRTENWILTWSIPDVITQCSNTAFCVSVDNTSTIVNYRENSFIFRDLVQEVVKRGRRILQRSEGRRENRKGRRAGRKLLKEADAQVNENLAITDLVPGSSSACTIG